MKNEQAVGEGSRKIEDRQWEAEISVAESTGSCISPCWEQPWEGMECGAYHPRAQAGAPSPGATASQNDHMKESATGF